MPSINKIKASDGSGNAAVATIQSSRSSGSSTIIVDTVAGIPSSFMGSMGTPHTFVDPITAETITVISEATAVDFSGHVDSANLEIDDIAPGYTDLGSAAGDIVIIRPTTQWSDNLAATLAVSNNDDGTMKTAAVQTALGIGTEALNGWNALGFAPNTVTALGNRSYSCVFNATDLTGTLSPGMRLRTTRTVAAPTQCTSLNGTTQYYSKTSPAGMTFTDDFVVSAWVKLSSYADGTIASRYNGTSGWRLLITNGQLTMTGFNAGAANYSQVASYQSVPLNKWVHVAAQLDMSTFTATTTTSYCMIDGVDVPASVSRGGTNPTALVQAGNLEIGSQNGGGAPFPGKLAQVAIYSAKVTQATILASINQGLSGSETSLISAYSFNNSINDLNANANNLTANGSAVATNADSPFGGQADGTISSTLDYAEIMGATFSTNTTLTVRVPDGNAIPTSGGVSAVSYSTQASPYGWPGISNILGVAILQSNQTFTSTTNTQVQGLSVPVYVPTGRRIKVTFHVNAFSHSGSQSFGAIIWAGAVVSGTVITKSTGLGLSTIYAPIDSVGTYIPATQSFTVNAGVDTTGATLTLNAGVGSPTFLIVELA